MPIDPTTSELLTQIATDILDNTNEEITPAVMRGVLEAIVNSLDDYGNADNLAEGAVNLFLTAAERTKLASIEANAGENPPLASLLEIITGTDTNARLWSVALLRSFLTTWVLSSLQVNVPNATQLEMEQGLQTQLRLMSPKLVADAIAALAGGVGVTAGQTFAQTFKGFGSAAQNSFLPTTGVAETSGGGYTTSYVIPANCKLVKVAAMVGANVNVTMRSYANDTSSGGLIETIGPVAMTTLNAHIFDFDTDLVAGDAFYIRMEVDADPNEMHATCFFVTT